VAAISGYSAASESELAAASGVAADEAPGTVEKCGGDGQEMSWK
jgi:hypothetical protein